MAAAVLAAPAQAAGRRVSLKLPAVGVIGRTVTAKGRVTGRPVTHGTVIF